LADFKGAITNLPILKVGADHSLLLDGSDAISVLAPDRIAIPLFDQPKQAWILREQGFESKPDIG